MSTQASLQDWIERATRDLKGKPLDKLDTPLEEGILLRALYTALDRQGRGDDLHAPGSDDLRRGTSSLGQSQQGWELRQRHAAPHPQTANTHILEDLQRGVDSIELTLHTAPQPPFGDPGVPIRNLADLHATLDNVRLDELTLALDAGHAALPAAALVLALAEQRGLPTLHLEANLDPLGALIATGALPSPLDTTWDQAAALAAHLHAHNLGRALRIDASPLQHGGAHAAQALGYLLAAGLDALRQLHSRGLGLGDAADQLVFKLRLPTTFFLGAAMLRAFRATWSSALQHLGLDPAAHPPRVHAAPDLRAMTRRDPWVNMLRNTATTFAAAIGGAEIVTAIPFDADLHSPSDLGRRIARNTQLILQREAHLHAVVDPAGGAYVLEALTDELAEKSWGWLQQVEAQGGPLQALTSGWLLDQIDAAEDTRRRDLNRRKRPITGVSSFPRLSDGPLPPAAILPDANPLPDAPHTPPPTLPQTTDPTFLPALIQAAAHHPLRALQNALTPASQQPPTALPRLLPRRGYADAFEALRDRADDLTARLGQRPAVLLVTLGDLAQHNARTTFAANLLEAGGLAAPIHDATAEPGPDALRRALEQRGARAALLCSSDDLYADQAEAALRDLHHAGAAFLAIAGRPAPELEPRLREAGLNDSCALGADALAFLQTLHTLYPDAP